MKEKTGEIWDYHDAGSYICITTNGMLDDNGHAIMGKGIALQAKRICKKLPEMLGEKLRFGNKTYRFPEYHLFTIPTKNNWRDKSDINLIRQSLIDLVYIVDYYEKFSFIELGKIYLPRPGCGNGGLDWLTEVKPIIKKILDNRFTIISPAA